MEKPTESSEEESDDELSESEESDGESSDNFGSDSDGKKFRHECETDGLSLSLSITKIPKPSSKMKPTVGTVKVVLVFWEV